jgi:oxygen-independent coproporphyrinogen-3 oxidase
LASLYVHVPFCSQRCIYCDYAFTTTSRDTGRYLRALSVEAEAVGREVRRGGPPVVLETLYIGGGTPSLIGADGIARVLEIAHRHFDTSALAETTVEVNPEDIAGADGLAFLRGIRALGVDRLSVGVQSFFDDDLRFMNRAHDAGQAESAVAAVAETFERFSVDLIFGLPEQPFEIWGANLERALRLGAPHVSAYTLTVEERTPLERMVRAGLVVPEGDEALRERYLFTDRYLTERGFDHYEVSSFARPGMRSRHNDGYWTHRNVVGLGPSAHSFWRETRSRAARWGNVPAVGRWQGLLEAGTLPTAMRESVGPDALADEAVMLGLRRLEDGLLFETMERDYGLDLLTDKRAELAALAAAGLVVVTPERMRLTPEGATVSDAVALKLVG